MKTIRFSHKYPKLRESANRYPQTATLLAVFRMDRQEICAAFLEYDTQYVGIDGECEYYKLPNGELLVLLFLGDNGVLFTTIRSNRKHPYDKEAYYRGAVGETFNVEIGAEK